MGFPGWASFTAAFLLAVAKGASAQPYGGYPSTNGAAKSVSVANAAVEFNKLSAICAIPVTGHTLGSIFCRIKGASDAAKAAARLREGDSLALSFADVEGPVCWLLGSYARSLTNRTVSFIAVRVSDSVIGNNLATVQQVFSYAPSATCVADGVLLPDTQLSLRCAFE